MADMEIMQQQDSYTKVAIRGRLDIDGVGQLETRFNAALCPSRKHAVVDFSGVTFLSSMGIRMLVSAAKTLMRRGAKMVLLSPQALVHESLMSASLDQLIPIVDSDEDAAKILAGD